MTAIRFFSASAAHRGVPPSGARQAFLLLRTVFTIAPIVFGLDKFFEVMTDWDKYLAPWINDLVPGILPPGHARGGRGRDRGRSARRRRPRIGAYVVARGRSGSSSTCSPWVDTPTWRCATSACWSAPSPWPLAALARGRPATPGLTLP